MLTANKDMVAAEQHSLSAKQPIPAQRTHHLKIRKMTSPTLNIDVFQSNDKEHLFSHCCFVFKTVTIGDFEQVVLAKSLVAALEDLIGRLDHYTPVSCTSNSVEATFSLIIERDTPNALLPFCVESFDGDRATFLDISGESFLIVKPWNEHSLYLEKLSISQYRSAIVSGLSILKQRMHDLAKCNSVV